MATTTSFTDKIGVPSNAFTLKVALTYEGDSSTNKTTISSIKGYVKRNHSSYVPTNTEKLATIDIDYQDENGKWILLKQLKSTSKYSFSSDSYYTWVSGSDIEVPHKADGTQSIRITFAVDGLLEVYYPVGSVTKTIALDQLHKAPDNISYTIEELNTNLSVANNVFVANLSKKRFTIAGTLYDAATASSYAIYNGAKVYSSSTNVVDIDFSQNELSANYPDENGNNKVPIRARITDSSSALGYSDIALYDFIPYVKPTLIDTSTNAKRNGQTSGKVLLNILGNYFNGVIGNIEQSNTYKPKVEYHFWENGTEEPTEWITINSSKVKIENGSFKVTDFEIGSEDTTATNYFDYQKSYKVNVRVTDNFYVGTLINPKSVPVGEATWTEYKDRVDFKKLTIQGEDPFKAKEYDLTEYETLSGITTTRTRCIKKMDRIVIDFVIRCAISANTDTTIYTLPEELRPPQSVEFVAIANSGNTKIIGIGFINSNGMIRVNLASALTTSGYLRCCIVYDL